ncbi:MAG TPA: hypothetical protein VKT32_09955 [Chthonomonadaceae bacterium]|nr:hypothetical protein [Chthonomonadaceae bacterium]
MAIGGALASLLGVSLLTAGAGLSRADIIVKDPTVTSHGSNFTWSYDVTLTNDEIIKPGNFLTIYDFAGFVPGSNFQPAGWVFSSANLGRTPPHSVPTDDPRLPNLTWTYTGTSNNDAYGNPDRVSILGPGPLDLGIFGADSNRSQEVVGMFATEAIKYSPRQRGNGRPVDNSGYVGVPNAVLPESSSLLLLLPGLAPLVLLRRRR